MAKIKTCVITCSSDGELDVRKLLVWGQIGRINSLPENRHEANRRILGCQKEYRCEICDAEIHKIVIERTKITKLQLVAYGDIQKSGEVIK